MFKVGDKVRRKNDFHMGMRSGDIATISQICSNNHVEFKEFGGQHMVEYLEPVESQRRRIYLAGPMRGIPHFNFPAFHRAAAILRNEGHEVFNPAEADIARIGVDPSLDNPTGDVALAAKRHGLSRRECLAEDLSWIALNADAIALLPGWVLSSGARAEYALAEALGLEVIRL